MKIQITDGVGIRGVSHQRGDIVDVSDGDARLLIQLKRAVPVAADHNKDRGDSADLTVENSPLVEADLKQPRRKWKKGE